MKTVVLAYHEVGCAGLEFLKQAGADITGVFTHQDDPTENLWFGCVAQRAKDYGLNVYAPERINDPEWVEVLRNCEPEILFSFYYRKLVFRRNSRGSPPWLLQPPWLPPPAFPRPQSHKLGDSAGRKEDRCHFARNGGESRCRHDRRPKGSRDWAK